jgi:hypothetical protein
MCSSTLSSTSALDGMGGQRHAPAALPLWKDPVPILQDAGLAPETVWTGVENLTPVGFDPRTVQPVLSRCTDWAIVAHQETVSSSIRESKTRCACSHTVNSSVVPTDRDFSLCTVQQFGVVISVSYSEGQFNVWREMTNKMQQLDVYY